MQLAVYIFFVVVVAIEAGVAIWCVLYTYPWQCKICGLPGYPYGCRGHSDPPSDLELVHGMLWPHLPKNTIEFDRWRTPGPTIKVYWKDRVVTTLQLIPGFKLVMYCYDRKCVGDGFPGKISCDHLSSWNLADPNSTMQIVNKIKEIISICANEH